MVIRAWSSRERLDGGKFISIKLVFAARGMEGIIRGAQWVVCRVLGTPRTRVPPTNGLVRTSSRTGSNKENLHLLIKD